MSDVIDTTPGEASATPAAPAPTVAAPPPAPPRDYRAEAISAAINPRQAAAEELSPELRALRAEPARQLFPASVMYKNSGIEELFDGTPTAGADVLAWQERAADLSLSTNETASFARMISEARAKPPEADVVEGWGRDAVAKLRLQYGDRTDSMIADARRLVARDPAVKQLLQQSGLGNKFEVISIFISRAASAKAVGRLK